MRLEQFCKSLLNLPFGKSKALANLIMALASNLYHQSVVKLSLIACYHYQYIHYHVKFRDLLIIDLLNQINGITTNE
jgi:hypothetical protein